MPDLRRRASDLRALLDRLAAAGRDPPLDLDGWEDALAGRGRSAVRRWFLIALRAEWLPLDPPTALAAAMTDHVYEVLRVQPGPWAALWGHIQRVAGCARWLADQRRADAEAAYLAALFHDASKLEERATGLPHEELGAAFAARALAGELPSGDVRLIREAIAIHPDRPPLSWTVACILHDADKLDKVGAAGLLRRASQSEDGEEACAAAWRVLDEGLDFPPPCFSETHALLRPRLAFSRTLEPLLDEVCDDGLW